jgi:hypothetical protein
MTIIVLNSPDFEKAYDEVVNNSPHSHYVNAFPRNGTININFCYDEPCPPEIEQGLIAAFKNAFDKCPGLGYIITE